MDNFERSNEMIHLHNVLLSLRYEMDYKIFYNENATHFWFTGKAGNEQRYENEALFNNEMLKPLLDELKARSFFVRVNYLYEGVREYYIY